MLQSSCGKGQDVELPDAGRKWQENQGGRGKELYQCRPVRLLSVAPFESIIYPHKEDPGAVTVTSRDLYRLEHVEFLNDTLIDFYIKYLQHSKSHIGLWQNNVYAYSSFFYGKLLRSLQVEKGDPRAAFEHVKKWTRRIDPFSYDYLMFPIHHSLHWSLIIVCHPRRLLSSKENSGQKATSGALEEQAACMIHLDSLEGGHRAAESHIRNYLWEECFDRQGVVASKASLRDLQCVPVQVPQQDNHTDCGLFLLHYVEMFLKQSPRSVHPSKQHKDYPSFLRPEWFKPAEASAKREILRTCILREARKASTPTEPPDAARTPLSSGSSANIIVSRDKSLNGNLQQPLKLPSEVKGVGEPQGAGRARPRHPRSPANLDARLKTGLRVSPRLAAAACREGLATEAGRGENRIANRAKRKRGGSQCAEGESSEGQRRKKMGAGTKNGSRLGRRWPAFIGDSLVAGSGVQVGTSAAVGEVASDSFSDASSDGDGRHRQRKDAHLVREPTKKGAGGAGGGADAKGKRPRGRLARGAAVGGSALQAGGSGAHRELGRDSGPKMGIGGRGKARKTTGKRRQEEKQEGLLAAAGCSHKRLRGAFEEDSSSDVEFLRDSSLPPGTCSPAQPRPGGRLDGPGSTHSTGQQRVDRAKLDAQELGDLIDSLAPLLQQTPEPPPPPPLHASARTPEPAPPPLHASVSPVERPHLMHQRSPGRLVGISGTPCGGREEAHAAGSEAWGEKQTAPRSLCRPLPPRLGKPQGTSCHVAGISEPALEEAAALNKAEDCQVEKKVKSFPLPEVEKQLRCGGSAEQENAAGARRGRDAEEDQAQSMDVEEPRADLPFLSRHTAVDEPPLLGSRHESAGATETKPEVAREQQLQSGMPHLKEQEDEEEQREGEETGGVACRPSHSSAGNESQSQRFSPSPPQRAGHWDSDEIASQGEQPRLLSGESEEALPETTRLGSCISLGHPVPSPCQPEPPGLHRAVTATLGQGHGLQHDLIKRQELTGPVLPPQSSTLDSLVAGRVVGSPPVRVQVPVREEDGTLREYRSESFSVHALEGKARISSEGARSSEFQGKVEAASLGDMGFLSQKGLHGASRLRSESCEGEDAASLAENEEGAFTGRHVASGADARGEKKRIRRQKESLPTVCYLPLRLIPSNIAGERVPRPGDRVAGKAAVEIGNARSSFCSQYVNLASTSEPEDMALCSSQGPQSSLGLPDGHPSSKHCDPRRAISEGKVGVGDTVDGGVSNGGIFQVQAGNGIAGCVNSAEVVGMVTGVLGLDEDGYHSQALVSNSSDGSSMNDSDVLWDIRQVPVGSD